MTPRDERGAEIQRILFDASPGCLVKEVTSIDPAGACEIHQYSLYRTTQWVGPHFSMLEIRRGSS
jgi:hypothetical protein